MSLSPKKSAVAKATLPRMKAETPLPIPDQDREAFSIYLEDIGKYPLLSLRQEKELAAKIQAGDQAARERMIQSNLRLVVRIAHDYAYYGVPLLDLISEGNIGLMKATERFDPSKDVKFATYAAWWIKQCIKRALANQGKTIRLPIHLAEKLARIRKATDSLREKLKRDPTNEEIAKLTNLPLAKVVHLKLMRLPPASFEARVGKDQHELGTVIADENAPTPLEGLLQSGLKDELHARLQNLNEREREILRMRFGLDEHKPLTLEEVGHTLGITRERVRQLEGEALLKLRGAIESSDQALTSEELRKEKRARSRAEVIEEFLNKLAESRSTAPS